jgi:hypothetical protein
MFKKIDKEQLANDILAKRSIAIDLIHIILRDAKLDSPPNISLIQTMPAMSTQMLLLGFALLSINNIMNQENFDRLLKYPENAYLIGLNFNCLKQSGLYTEENATFFADNDQSKSDIASCMFELRGTALATQVTLNLLREQPKEFLSDIFLSLGHLRKANLLTPKNFNLLLKNAQYYNHGLSFALSALEESGLLTQINFDLLLGTQSEDAANIHLELSILKNAKIDTQENFSVLIHNIQHINSISLALKRLSDNALLNQNNFNALFHFSYLLKDVLTNLIHINKPSQEAFDSIITQFLAKEAAVPMKQRVLPNIARQTIKTSCIGTQFFTAKTEDGVKIMKYVDPKDIADAVSPRI